MTNKRVFIAIELEESIKDYLQEMQNKIIKNSTRGNFTIKDNFHLTLKFIGEVEDEIIEKIKVCIDDVASRQNDFNLQFSRLGEFPRGNKTMPWVGVKRSESLDKLHLDMENSLEEVSIKKEGKKFTPHITLGRQVVLNRDFSKLVDEIAIEDLTIIVDKISLMESTRINGKLKYIPLYVKKLK
ncbi:RNA 2',3'-cyclic phosphodiesterase [Clostridium cylindrosporum]|uniref:RNA 2',3'-cyclic phosphodiesterase n=1 Tax=Clostridium cylindrosporum TaxID=1495 RepID=UPI0013793507|nr:RNA 2',3'-cyclic phosphodiesterase [Clostridium cylindrosporum]